MEIGSVKYRIGKNYGFKGLVTVFAFACVVPLLYIAWIYQSKLSVKSLAKINWHFSGQWCRRKPVAGEPGGGIRSMRLSAASSSYSSRRLSTIPIGIFAGIYLSENRKGRLAYWCRLCTDILQGVPSIVIGIVAYFWIVKPLGGFSAISGSIALAIMMLPIVVRSTEETLKLLPSSLQEAAFFGAGHALSPRHLQGRHPGRDQRHSVRGHAVHCADHG